MEALSYGPVADVRQLFDNVSSDAMLARTLLYSQTQDIARIVGLENLRRAKYEREIITIGRIREALQAEVVPPKCDCPAIGEGLRWHMSDRQEPVPYAIDSSVFGLFEGVENYIHESFAFVAGHGRRLEFSQASAANPARIKVSARPYDGQGRTLGVTVYYRTEDLDLDVFGARRPSVEIVIDSDEFWTANYFRTVFRHEVVHAVGVGHSPVAGDLQYEFYTGINLGRLAAWAQGQVDSRYTHGVSNALPLS